MPTITLSVPSDLKQEMDKSKFINWSEVAREAIRERVAQLAVLNAIAVKSKLTEKDALEINDSNSEKGINLIFENTSDIASLKDSLSRFDFLIISDLYFSISSVRYSGANKEKSFRKIKSRVFPVIEISAEITMFASIINSIQKAPG